MGKRAAIIGIFVGSVISCFGQVELSLAGLSVSTGGTPPDGGFWPTNYGTPISYYYGDDATNTMVGSTNAVPTWNDKWANSWHLTNANRYANAPLAQTNSLNGRTTLLFDGTDDFLRSATWTNPQPWEMWMVMRVTWTNSGASQNFIDAVATTTFRDVFYKNAADNAAMYAGGSTLTATATLLTNKFVVWTTVWDGANSRVLTNNSVLRTGSPGTANQSGLTIGAGYNLSGPANIDVAELCLYSATNSGVTATAIYQGLTNRYGAQNF